MRPFITHDEILRNAAQVMSQILCSDVTLGVITAHSYKVEWLVSKPLKFWLETYNLTHNEWETQQQLMNIQTSLPIKTYKPSNRENIKDMGFHYIFISWISNANLNLLTIASLFQTTEIAVLYSGCGPFQYGHILFVCFACLCISCLLGCLWRFLWNLIINSLYS